MAFKLWSSSEPDTLDYWLVAEYCNKLLKEYTVIEKLKICQHYDYQCCDSDEWRSSRAKQIIDSTISKLISQLQGYEEASWGLSHE